MHNKSPSKGILIQLWTLLRGYRSYLGQALLRSRWRVKNTIGKGALISKDVIIPCGASIGENAILGSGVYLSQGVSVGRGAHLFNISVGDNSSVDYGVLCTGYGSGKIHIGKESYIGIRNILDWSDHISIGDFVHIAGPSTALWTHTSARMSFHGLPLFRKDDKHYRPTAPITVESNVYIGGNCTIYPGVTIHHHAVIVPNSAVTKDVPSYALYGGVPAKLIKIISPESF